MPVHLVQTCPHCEAEQMTFDRIGEREDPIHDFLLNMALACNSCGRIIGATIVSTHAKIDFNSANGRLDELLKKADAVLAAIYPMMEAEELPHHVPENILRILRQARSAARRSERDSAGSMFRKVVDIATKHLDAGLSGKNLASRIDGLAKAGRLTDDLRQLAHLVRLDGNDAAHEEEELSDSDIEQLSSFTLLFLQYTFTLPTEVRLKIDQDEEFL